MPEPSVIPDLPKTGMNTSGMSIPAQEADANRGQATNSGGSRDSLESGKWTRFLPKTFGIQDSARESSYRWCVREGGMWGIATATAMSLHRLRMGSKPLIAGHFFFGTFTIVMLPSYYFCYRRRDHKEHVIETMMKYNRFGRATDLPAEPPLQEHPFWEQNDRNNTSNGLEANSNSKHSKEFRGMIKERKEWQKSQDPSFDEIFQETK